MAAIDRYISEIIVTMVELPDKQEQFLETLTIPLQRNNLDLLNSLQTSEIGSYEHFETSMDPNHYPILPVELYLDIERQREEAMVAAHAQPDSSLIAESEHIHNKAVFDSLNESLSKFRPYGLSGDPMPWSTKQRRL